jgi:hypothetical protein
MPSLPLPRYFILEEDDRDEVRLTVSNHGVDISRWVKPTSLEEGWDGSAGYIDPEAGISLSVVGGRRLLAALRAALDSQP